MMAATLPSRAQTARQAGLQAWCIELGHMAAHMPGTLTIATHTTLCACIASARPLAAQRLPRHLKSIGCSIASLAYLVEHPLSKREVVGSNPTGGWHFGRLII